MLCSGPVTSVGALLIPRRVIAAQIRACNTAASSSLSGTSEPATSTTISHLPVWEGTHQADEGRNGNSFSSLWQILSDPIVEFIETT